jgi:AcrR family transcriptional regulator
MTLSRDVSTTVAEIAARAGLTERTFFRHFADKREVLFARSTMLQEQMVQALAATDDFAAPIEKVAAALAAAAELLTDREYPRQRQPREADPTRAARC